MKHKLIFLAFFLISGLINAQTPQKFNYQAVARDTSGNLFTNKNVSFRINILQGSANGTSVYQETHQKTTNAYGQVTLTIGAGSVVSGNFSTINWGTNSYFIKTEMDASGGSNFLIMGTSQLLSVPYALYSINSGSSNGIIKLIADSTNDTKVQVEKTTNEDKIRFDLGGTERWVMSDARLESKNNGYSLFIGDSAGYSDDLNYRNNTFVGYKSGRKNTSGYDNTALGSLSLYSNSTGYQNIAIGKSTLTLNTTGHNNTALGVSSLNSNITGSENTAVGQGTLYSNTTGFQNTAIGNSSLYTNSTGYYNTANGYQALYYNSSGIDKP